VLGRVCWSRRNWSKCRIAIAKCFGIFRRRSAGTRARFPVPGGAIERAGMGDLPAIRRGNRAAISDCHLRPAARNLTSDWLLRPIVLLLAQTEVRQLCLNPTSIGSGVKKNRAAACLQFGDCVLRGAGGNQRQAVVDPMCPAKATFDQAHSIGCGRVPESGRMNRPVSSLMLRIVVQLASVSLASGKPWSRSPRDA
jgi:hypothetical protein